jgi:teichuronic acid biosynthesis glycosyltransferase TuaC
MNAPESAKSPLTPSLSPDRGRGSIGGVRLAEAHNCDGAGDESNNIPHILVFTTVFPNEKQPRLGLFVRERMFRVAERLPLKVVAPVPWFPFQGLVRRFRPSYRPMPPRWEIQQGIEVLHPRFFSVPGLFRWMDGLSMALSCLPTLLSLRRRFHFDVIDSHFAYPDGYAATLLALWFKIPAAITLRGTEVPVSRFPLRRRLMLAAVRRATRVFAVADSLARHLKGIGCAREILRVGNGVDTARFYPEARDEARQRLDIPANACVLVSVGGLCERKGFHRVLAVLPALRKQFPELLYLIVGGPSPEGDWSDRLQSQVRELRLENAVRFLGPLEPDQLRWPLSAADLFVLATANEGWANVFLEAMACGLPVVTTDVGGNAEVVADPSIGLLVPFSHPERLESALSAGLARAWDRSAIRAWAETNSWTQRVDTLVRELATLHVRQLPVGAG